MRSFSHREHSSSTSRVQLFEMSELNSGDGSTFRRPSAERRFLNAFSSSSSDKKGKLALH